MFFFFFQGYNKGFIINLQFQNEAIEFEPSFKQFRDQLNLLYDFLMDACWQTPRLETILYKELGGPNRPTLRVSTQISVKE